MRKILFCWELGEDYGHLSLLLALAQEFTNQQTLLYIASKDLSLASKIHWPDNVKFIQAPGWFRSHPQASKAESLGEILLYKGYDSAKHLQFLADAWATIIEFIAPDTILFDHSPTALLAASRFNIPKVIISNPYITPTPNDAAIKLSHSALFDEQKAREIHDHVIKTINSVRANSNVAPITNIGELFITDAIFLSGFAEMDYFKDSRTNVTYCGATLAASVGTQAPVWKPGLSRKIFVYLKHRDPRSEAILKILKTMQARALCFYADGKPEDISQYQDSSLAVSNVPFDLSKVYAETTLIICHGGQGVVNEALRRGIPLVIVPTHAEQHYVGKKIKDCGFGLVIEKGDDLATIEKKLTHFFSCPDYYEKAKFLAETVFNLDPHTTRLNIKLTIESLINSQGN